MRSPWREPQQSAGRRARPKVRAAAQQMSGADCVHLSAQARHRLDAPLGAPLPLLLRGANLEWRGGSQNSGTTCRESGIACVIASESEAIQGGLRERLMGWTAPDGIDVPE